MATQNNNTQQLQMPVGSEQQLTMPSYELQQKLQQPQTSTWDKIKNAANNFADATQAAAVGYATGASLGNFDEAMGTATAAVTGIANAAGLYLDKVPLGRASARPFMQLGKKIFKQGINSSADKIKNTFYNKDDDKDEEEEEYYYWW